MILVDRRIGSKDLEPLLQGRGVQVTLDDLPYGDVAFEGNGPEGRCMIGIERKRLKDMLSSMSTGRFSGHQLPGLMEMYSFQFLVVEGLWRPGSDGMLEIWSKSGWFPASLGSRRFMHRQLSHFLTTLQLMTPIRVIKTAGAMDTAANMIDLYGWFNNKQWSQHRGHQAFAIGKEPIQIVKPSFTRRVAKELPHVGWQKSQAIADHFQSVAGMCGASYHDWQEIEGIGPKSAHDIIRALNGIGEE